MVQRNYSRSRHRDQNHNAAHATDHAPEQAMHHQLVPKGPAPLIATSDGLDELLAHLRAAGRFAYDSEFIGELTYLPKLCVIQVATSQRVALIDPLAGLNLTPFWEVLCDPSIEKIVHAGQQDIEPVFRFTQRAPANIFDTQIAAGFIALPYPVSLSKLVMELTGAKLGKGLTFTHWDQRPLSAMQLRYAADDVRYLPLLREEIGNRLAAAGHAEWAMEECAAQCEPSVYQFDPDVQYLRVRGVGSLAPQGLAILRELTIWRDGAARAEDVPPRTMLRDEILVDIARSPVTSAEKLSRVRGLPRPVESAHGQQLVDAVNRAMAMPESSYPQPRETEQSPTERFRADALWARAQMLCYEQKIDPALVSSRQEIGEFYRAVTTGKSVDQHHLMTGWRKTACGERLLEQLRI